MKVYDLRDEEGRVFALEVSNTLLGRRRLCRLVQSIPGARILRSPRAFSLEEEFCEFEIQGQEFVAWEPFGDNSRYWIGPKSGFWCEQVEAVRTAFVLHKPWNIFG